MAETVLTDALVWLAGHRLDAYMNEVGLEIGRTMLDNTRFGDAVVRFSPGLRTATATMAGFWESTPDALLSVDADAGTPNPLTIAGNAAAEGDAAYTFHSLIKVTNEGTINELLKFSVTASVAGSPGVLAAGFEVPVAQRGTLLFHKTSTGAENGAATQLGALVGQDNVVFVSAHLVAFSGTSVQFALHSDDNSGMTSSTLQIGRTLSAANTAEYFTVRGPITDDWWQLQLVGTYTSAEIAVCWGVI